MARLQVLIREPATERRWLLARLIAMALLAAFLTWIWYDGSHALPVLWYAVVPALPAVFFLNPVLWRGVCPLATMNGWGNRIGRQQPLSPRLAASFGAGGVVLFHLLVPARHFLFNEHGAVLCLTIVIVGLLALALGAMFEVRSAFCNALCPILPVELLYGQRPLVRLERGRCTSCTVCTPRGCLDLAQGKAAVQLIGARREGRSWLMTPFGMFAAALPGFIIGYSLVPDGHLGRAGQVYAATVGGSLLSYLVVAGLVAGLRVGSRVALPVVGAVAGILYYGFAGPAIAGALSLPWWAAPAVQSAGIGLVAVWLLTALRTGRQSPPGPQTGSLVSG